MHQSVKIGGEANGEEDKEVVNMVVVDLEVLEVDVVDPVILGKVEGACSARKTYRIFYCIG